MSEQISGEMKDLAMVPGGGGGTCLIFVCGCANTVSETVPFLLQFFPLT